MVTSRLDLSMRSKLLAAVLITASMVMGSVTFAPAASAAPKAGTVAYAVTQLRVATENRAGYTRAAFEYWADANGDCQDTRSEVLQAETRSKVSFQTGSRCIAMKGRWHSAVDGRTWTKASDVDIDHHVPLAEAWDSGAKWWNTARREAFANDLGYAGSLNTITDNVNISKGNRDPSEWMPPRAAARCTYVKQWISVKYRWSLTIDPAEKRKLRSVASGACGAARLTMPARAVVPVDVKVTAPTRPLTHFPIGVWVPPADSMTKWAGRGINTVVGIPQGHDPGPWVAAAAKAGLRQIRAPRTDVPLEQDGADPLLTAWLHPDEPDLNDQRPAELAAARERWRAAAPQVPVVVNLSGGEVLKALNSPERTAQYRAWLNTADWASQDLYPVTGWGQPDWHDHRHTRPTTNQQANNILAALQGDRPRPLLNFIECADQRLGWVPPGSNPTPQQQSGHVWDAIINGARGIVYFPVAFNPFTFDNMTPAQVAQMTADNERIKQLEPWLIGTRAAVPVPSPFQRATFTRSDGTMKTLTINQSNAAATLDGRAFQAYEMVVS
jgi:Protein of unknown function (DUF1524)